MVSQFILTKAGPILFSGIKLKCRKQNAETSGSRNPSKGWVKVKVPHTKKGENVRVRKLGNGHRMLTTR